MTLIPFSNLDLILTLIPDPSMNPDTKLLNLYLLGVQYCTPDLKPAEAVLSCYKEKM
jgi:hypothetical protein